MMPSTYSIIIPTYNEQKTIEKVVQMVKKTKYPGRREIIIIDDGSADGTSKKIKKIAGIVKVFNKENRGKGFCVRLGIAKAGGDVILIQDADLEYNPKDHLKLIERLTVGDCDAVFGSRFLSPGHKPRYRLFYWGNIFLSLLIKLLYKKNITDVETCYKCFKKSVVSKIKLGANRFDFEPEITCKLLNAGFNICEVPISYKSRSYSEGKKIGLWDGILAIFAILRYRFFI